MENQPVSADSTPAIGTVADFDREMEALKNPAENAESAPADAPEQTEESESAGDSETPKDIQEPSKKPRSGDQRVAQLDQEVETELAKDNPDLDLVGKKLDIIKRIKEGQQRKTEPAPVAQPQAQQPKPQFPPTRPEPTIDDKNPDGTPKYDDIFPFMKDLAKWEGEQALEGYKRELAEQSRQQQLAARDEEARQRYGKEFETVIKPECAAIQNSNLHDVLKDAVLQSELRSDVAHRLATDAEAKAKFVALATSDPFGAVKYIGVLEEAARQKISGQNRNDKGQFAANADTERGTPEPKKTSAPKPPSPVGGATTRGFDPNDENLSNEEWMRQMNIRDQRRKG